MEGNKKNETNVFSSSEVMSLLENMNDGIKIIAEGQQDLSRRVDVLESKIDKVQSDVTDIKIELGGKVDRDIIQNHEKRLEKLESVALSGA